MSDVTAVEQEPKAAEDAKTQAPVEPVEKEKSLDELLSEYEQEGQGAQPEQKDEPQEAKRDPEIEALLQRETQRDIESAVRSVKDSQDVLKGRSDDLVQGYLERQAAKDPRIAQAWAQRLANPNAWGRVLDSLGKQMAKEFEAAPDPQLTEDREAVRASVRGSSTEAPPETKVSNDDLAGKSDAEFDDYLAKEHGYRRNTGGL